MSEHICRFCSAPLNPSFVDLGVSPLSNAYRDAEQLEMMEPFYPLHLYVCEKCLLVQLPVYQTPDMIFSDYAYFSSYSKSWLDHARKYVEMMIRRFGFDTRSQVIEVASNDGYLLQSFQQHDIPVLGVEPALNVAKVAVEAGIPTLTRFFGVAAAEDMKRDGFAADLLLGNNVLAHVPDLNDFVKGLKILLKPGGIITMEFPHLLNMMEQSQFDTIYHEHFSYFSLLVVRKIFAFHGLELFDAEQLTTHGGSLRIYAAHAEKKRAVTEGLLRIEEREKRSGLEEVESYTRFSRQVQKVKRDLLDFLIQAKRRGKTIVGYGAPAKGNTLLNHCGVRNDFLDYTVDLSPHKQGRYLPGTRIPIYHPNCIAQTRPNYLLILPWNLQDEIIEEMSGIRQWGGKFVLPIPDLRVVA